MQEDVRDGADDDREGVTAEVPRLRRPDRSQMLLDPVCLDERLPADHPARTVWKAVERLDLSQFYEPLKARGSEPGRAATDPKLLMALWLYAATEGVGSGREIVRLCQYHDAYRWLCGGVSVNYHTLNDLRVGHEKALDDLFTNLLVTLIRHDLVKVRRVSQDGTRIRASAGSSSFRRQPTLKRQLKEVREHIEALKRQGDGEASVREKAAQERAASQREARLKAALAELPKIEVARAKSRDKSRRERPARASSTDPEARVMRMPDGGYRPAYNVQLATDTESRAIVGVDVTNAGRDANEAAPMREQIKQRTGCVMSDHLMDGDFVSLEGVEEAEKQGVNTYAPPPEARKGGDAYSRRKGDSDEVAAWRQRMSTAEAQEIYKQRCSTSETVNADLKQHRGLRSVNVRGQPKVRCIALWVAMAYNIMHFAEALLA
ncbi:MAG: IS1182 family transposase [Planctomycetota bacterium]|jgi:transposase